MAIIKKGQDLEGPVKGENYIPIIQKFFASPGYFSEVNELLLRY